jgi:hypothetical protein
MYLSYFSGFKRINIDYDILLHYCYGCHFLHNNKNVLIWMHNYKFPELKKKHASVLSVGIISDIS